ncbi:MAG: TonB-dependent receptor [Cyclobacteriaceae bacterium]
MKLIVFVVSVFFTTMALGQEQPDTIPSKRLNAVEVKGQRLYDIDRLPEYEGTNLWTGKKNEVINIQSLNANIAEKTGRQIFAKVPGVFVYDMDGSGNQMNISTRGLDAHRGWEFNIRRNGAITNSDMYGYPASHYSIPMESVDRIELVRGTGSLQYGAQFGGMLNYVTKKPDSTRILSIENITSVGSYGLMSTFLSASGKAGKFQYLAYYTKRVSDGYRENSNTDYDAQSFLLMYSPTTRLKFTAELSRSNYVYKIPGPLTDAMFEANPRQATRSRNYFNPEIYVPSIRMDWSLGEHTQISWVTSAVLGYRNSVMFDKPANVVDAIDPVTLQFAPRQVDIDNFNSYTSELRLLHRYRLFNQENSIVGGVQVFNNDLHRRQQGTGTTGTDFDLTVTESGFGRDMHLKSKNVAFFIENKFQVLPQLSITPGARLELGESVMSGIISYYDPEDVPNTIEHKFPLLGISAQYRVKKTGTLYAGLSQAYRPVIFKDLIPGSVYEKVDKNLKDASGYNLEAGFRGNTKSFRCDVSLFHLRYNSRMGTQAMYDENDVFYLYRTNIGNSVTDGAELFAEYGIRAAKDVSLSLFTSTAFFRGVYTDAEIRSGDTNLEISGNRIESVPEIITRNGVNVKWRIANISFLYSYVGSSYADAANTETPSANGAVGIVPAYGLLDINSTFLILNQITLRVNVNNVASKQYFTKRPSFYPGPGVWSSDGRSVVVSIGFKI